MEQDRRSPSLQNLGVRTWRGAAMFGLQAFAFFLPVLIAVKIIGSMLGVEAIVVFSWSQVGLAPIASAVGLFIAVAFHAYMQNLMNK